MAVKIITDRIACLPHQVISNLGLAIASLNIHFGVGLFVAAV
ncbi:hypothetical protein ACFLXP_03020 [Chloroflexota bacterium]